MSTGVLIRKKIVVNPLPCIYIERRRRYGIPPTSHGGGDRMDRFQVPDAFPRSRPAGAVPGAQTKFLAVEYEGRYYSPGCTPPEIHERWRYCAELVPQFVASCLRSKAGKRAHMSEQEILQQYLVRLIDSKWVTDVEADWVIDEVARQLDWPQPG